MTELNIGPLAIPLALPIAGGAVMLGIFIGNRIAARQGMTVERSLWLVLAAVVLVARAAFVARYWTFYAEAPAHIFDLRDGGFKPAIGIAAGVALAAWLAWRDRPRRKALLAGALAGSLVWSVGTAALAMARPQQALPALSLSDADGREVRLQAFAGRPLVVNLWASWCPPCRREMPELAKAQRAYKDVGFVFVNQGEAAGAIHSYLQEQGLQLDNVLLDRTNRMGNATGSPGLPTTLFFDAEGRLVDRRLGQLSAATLAQGIEGLREGLRR
jgi:thiol-disulfide isomerase/thioredoxin